MLEGVLAPGGTASEVSVPGYTLAGKTGTAQVAVNGGYSDTRFIASFVGFAPAQDPRLLVAVVVDEPQGDNYYGGTVAAPAFGEIAKFALPYLEIPTEGASAGTLLEAGALESPRWSSASCSPAPRSPRSPGIGSVEIAGLATTAASVEPGTCSSASAGAALGRPRVRRAGGRGRRRRAGRRAAPGPARDPGPRCRRAGRDGRRSRFASGATRRRELRVAGVTGTNGKTTTAFLIRHVLEAQGTQTGLLGTVKRVVGGVEEEVERTTPEAIDLQATFRRMLEAGDEACAMEVSSHALALRAHGRRSGSRSPCSPT